jgi:hypothetical protein
MLVGTNVYSDDKNKNKDEGTLLHARLRGFQEVPSVSTVAAGELRARINPGDTSIDYELTYSGLQGDVTQAHIHIGQRSVNGGIVLWFCGTSSNSGPSGTPTCTKGSGTFTGTFTSANVQAITGANVGQQVSAGEFAKVIAAIRSGVAYANVHTALSTGGEIRGQIRVVRREHHD